MGDDHYNWHRHWRRASDGKRLVHDSGLMVEYDAEQGYSTVDESLEPWSAYESRRGVSLPQQQAQLLRLLREAAQWDASAR